MSGEMAVSLALKLNDQGSGPASQALQKITRAMKETGEAAKTASTAAMSAFKKLADSREILGIRSEKAIQNEIKQTEAAYKRMAESGQVGAREMGRAQDAMRQKVAGLRKELDGVKSSAGGAGSALSKAAALFGAAQVGKMVLQGPINQTMTYDRALANLSNTAFAGKSLDERRSGMRTLDTAIVSAVHAGGGTREGAMGSLDKLVASGAFADVNEATRLLPILTKAGTASNSDPTYLADIAIRAKQTFGLTDTSLALDQAMKAGQLGGFELKDMAKWLPAQMAAARQSGLKGDDGFKTLLAANQAAAITAGSKDEAGNNVVNLLAKINSQDTSKDAQRLGINLSGTLAAARGKGVNSLDAFVNLTEQIVGKDQNYIALREKSKTATGDEKKSTYESMGDILQGSAIGKIIQDRQALMALLGIMNNRGYMDNIRGDLGNAKGTADDAFNLISESPSYKAEMMAAEKAIAMQTALDKVNPALGTLAEKVTELMRSFPALSAAVSGVGLLGYGVGSSVLTGRGLLSLLGFGGGAASTTGASAAAAATGASGSWSAGQLAAGSASAAFGLAPLALMAAVTKWAGNPNDTLGSSESDHGRTTSLMGFSDSLSKLFEGIGIRFGPGSRPQEPVEQPVREPIHVVVDVRNGNIVAAVNEANARNATRH